MFYMVLSTTTHNLHSLNEREVSNGKRNKTVFQPVGFAWY